jgi:hypothetical protein
LADRQPENPPAELHFKWFDPFRLTGRSQAELRAKLAFRLLWFFAVLNAALLALLAVHTLTFAEVSPFFLQFPTLLGAAIGFYFGRSGEPTEPTGQEQSRREGG